MIFWCISGLKNPFMSTKSLFLLYYSYNQALNFCEIVELWGYWPFSHLSHFMKIFFFFVFLYLLVCLYIYYNQQSFIFYPDILPEDYEFIHFGKTAEEIYFQPESNAKLHALKFAVPNPKGVILYFHGNARALDNWGYIVADLLPNGYDIIIPDYRGYGKSKGVRTEKNLFKDARYLFDQLASNYGPENVVLYGRSLGSGIASSVATESTPKLLILETPYYSIQRLASEQMHFLPINSLLKFKFRSDLFLPKVKCPVYIFHGTEDELIPYQHAVDLKALVPTIDFTTIPTASHNNLSHFALFNDKIATILE